jgi:hypothetical protein
MDVSWIFPAQTRAKAKQLHRVFDPYRESNVDPAKLKCSASEMLGVYELLRYIVAVRCPRAPELADKLLSFDAACHILDVLTAAKRGTIAAEQASRDLRVALQNHMTLFLAAYGAEGIRPKHHWNMDLPDQILRDQCVLDTFIIERSHLKVKRIGDCVKNLRRFERSVLSGVLNYDLRRAKEHWIHSLCGRTHTAGDGVFLSDKMYVYGLEVAC